MLIQAAPGLKLQEPNPSSKLDAITNPKKKGRGQQGAPHIETLQPPPFPGLRTVSPWRKEKRQKWSPRPSVAPSTQRDTVQVSGPDAEPGGSHVGASPELNMVLDLTLTQQLSLRVQSPASPVPDPGRHKGSSWVCSLESLALGVLCGPSQDWLQAPHPVPSAGPHWAVTAQVNGSSHTGLLWSPPDWREAVPLEAEDPSPSYTVYLCPQHSFTFLDMRSPKGTRAALEKLPEK